MIKKVVFACIGGILLFFVLLFVDKLINENNLGTEYQSTVTLLIKSNGIDVQNIKDCRLPADASQYCGNAKITQYGHHFIKLESVKDVPENNRYIKNLEKTVYISCGISALLYTSSCPDIVSTDQVDSSKTDIFEIWIEVIVALGICIAAMYYLLNKFLWTSGKTY